MTRQERIDAIMEAKKPRGKAQAAIMQALQGGPQQLTGLSQDKAFVGIHFGKIQKAAEALAKSGLISFDGQTLQMTEDDEMTRQERIEERAERIANFFEDPEFIEEGAPTVRAHLAVSDTAGRKFYAKGAILDVFRMPKETFIGRATITDHIRSKRMGDVGIEPFIRVMGTFIKASDVLFGPAKTYIGQDPHYQTGADVFLNRKVK